MKLLVVTALNLITVGLLIFFSTQYLFIKISENTIIETEKKLLESGMTVLKASISSYTKSLKVLTKDWALWDETYEFITNTNDDYINSNINEETLYNAGINMIVFFDTNGNVIYKKTLSLERNQIDVIIPAELFKTNKVNTVYKEIEKVINTKKGISQTITTDQGLLLYSIYPILPSTGEGEVRGALFIGRYFSGADEEEIRSSNNLDFNTKPFYNLSPNKQTALLGQEYIDEYEKTVMKRHFIIRDTFNNPALYLIFNYPRVVNNSYASTIPLFSVIAGIVGAITFLVSTNFIRLLKKIIAFTHR